MSINGTVGTVVSQSVVYMVSNGMDKMVAAGAIGTLSFISIAGRLLSGWLLDRIQARYVMAAVMLTACLGIIILINTKVVAMAYLFAAVFGLALGMLTPLFSVMFANYFGLKNLASILGNYYFLLAISAAMPPIAGAIFDKTGGMRKWNFLCWTRCGYGTLGARRN